MIVTVTGCGEGAAVTVPTTVAAAAVAKEDEGGGGEDESGIMTNTESSRMELLSALLFSVVPLPRTPNWSDSIDEYGELTGAVGGC